ncbi:FAD-binding oxidoreductase [Demequina sp. NBRC 110055]|uniref:FAD-binding oxidoreductase n=1 Tax=Demequina sp. NBRC 110055 TaxID=1570344 RepID=UPI001185304A|nr:FAD-binding oxidoreductase [Demequina sp. NBRC 110055]
MSALGAIDTTRIDALRVELVDILGEAAVATDDARLERASVDGSGMSPLIKELLPLGRAQILAMPSSAEQIVATVAAAVRHGVPVTPRGKGTGNYGQGIPMNGGLVLDTSKARRVIEVGDGWIEAEAGAVMWMLEQTANKAGQQLWMYPSTAQSTVGGFVSGGSGGTGSIANGMIHQGFVKAVEVVHATGEAAAVRVEGDDAVPYLHNYGTAGIITTVRVALEPLQPWRAVLASFDAYEDVVQLMKPLASLTPTPRLVSGDRAEIAACLPAELGIPAGRASLRAILDESTVEEATRMIEAAGGRVDDVREGAQHTVKLSMNSYNHPIEWLQKTAPVPYFHVEVLGDALVDRLDEVQAVYPGGMLHIEAQRGRPIGMLAAPYESAADVLAGFDRLAALGVSTHNPHQWAVDFEPERTAALAAVTDPQGLLNPGKLGATVHAHTGTQM